MRIQDEKTHEYYRDRISDAWADIRSYGGNLWQIVMLTVAASALVVNLITRPDSSGILLYFGSAGWLSMMILTGFTFFSFLSIIWISQAITERIMIIEGITVQLGIKEIPIRVGVKTEKVDKGITFTPYYIYRVLQWIPIKPICVFAGTMYTFSLFFWWVQTAWYSADFYLFIVLILFSIIVGIVMTYFLHRGWKPLMESLRRVEHISKVEGIK